MDRNQLLAFYYTIILGSTSQAAEKLGFTASWITKLLQKLEQQVGHQLLTKKGKHLVLTEKGNIFLKDAKMILNCYDFSLKKMQRLSDRMEGAFTLSLPPFISSLWFMEAITPLLKDNPHISFNIKTLREAPDFKAGEVDIDIRNVSPLFLDPQEVVAQYLTTYKLRLYASQAYVEEKGIPQNLYDFDDHTLISFMEDSLFPHMYEPLTIKCKQRLIIDCSLGIAHAVENGLGIGPLLPHIARQSPQPLVPILHNQLNQSLNIYYTYPATLKQNRMIQDFYNYLQGLPDDFLKGRVTLLAKRQ
ncbi:MAG: LysR family transcriptional regulator [Candidatus Paracaedibacteraceae bacterium]|nr:LysR family transcriptional regulator [Candidatus Paracaedibacteraceae bacterium]